MHPLWFLWGVILFHFTKIIAMLTIQKKVNEYRRTTGPVFVYSLKGTKEEMTEYKAAQGENYRESDSKEPLYFSRNPLQVGQELLKTQAGRFIVSSNLEELATKNAELIQGQLAKMVALQQFTGMTPAEIARLVLAA